MSQPAPVAVADRVQSLDVIRGFALLGILTMNIRGMAASLGAYLYPLSHVEYEGASRAAYLGTSIFFDLKMMGLFSMLFGAGVLLYAGKGDSAGAPPTVLWLRRMSWLFVIGLVHAYLIWDGDILVPYSLSGLLVLWWVRRRSARTLLTLGIVILVLGALLGAGQAIAWPTMAEVDRAEQRELMTPTPERAREELAAMRGSYVDVVAYRAPTVFMFQTLYYALFFFWRTSGMMLIGMALYKSGFLDGRQSPATYRRVATFCVPLGLAMAAQGAFALDRVRFALPDRILLDLWNYIGSIVASVGYAAVLVLIVKANRFAGLQRRLAAVGQMAFSNYLSHSIITSVIFLGWGFGLAGRLDYAEQLLVVLMIWVLQLVVSPLWLARFRFGPAEWLWRSLTYWQWQPMARPR